MEDEDWCSEREAPLEEPSRLMDRAYEDPNVCSEACWRRSLFRALRVELTYILRSCLVAVEQTLRR